MFLFDMVPYSHLQIIQCGPPFTLSDIYLVSIWRGQSLERELHDR